MNNKKDIILYGAYDRYNYGDNLMPIVLEEYCKQYHSQYLSDFNFIYASIKKSDLSKYGCLKTVPISNLQKNRKNETFLIIVGGEVLGAHINILYMHVQRNKLNGFIYKIIKKLSPSIATFFAKKNYKVEWDYPYIPNLNSFNKPINIFYNTVGGNPPEQQLIYLSEAKMISVRDQRTFNNLKSLSNIELVPDSVLIISKIFRKTDLVKKIGKKLFDKIQDRNYIVIQACPYKVNFTALEIANTLKQIRNKYNLEVILLPIGYATGHDDIFFLRDINKKANNEFLLVDDLSIWEIMYVIANAKAFYGTSLHGVITAMSYGVPHYCINEKIEKLVSFLDTWSVYPFTVPISYLNIEETLKNTFDQTILQNAIDKAQSLIINNFDKMINIFIEEKK